MNKKQIGTIITAVVGILGSLGYVAVDASGNSEKAVENAVKIKHLESEQGRCYTTQQDILKQVQANGKNIAVILTKLE